MRGEGTSQNNSEGDEVAVRPETAALEGTDSDSPETASTRTASTNFIASHWERFGDEQTSASKRRAAVKDAVQDMSEHEKAQFYRQRNAMYSRRKYMRKKIEIEVMEKQRDELKAKNKRLRQEERHLMHLNEEALRAVAMYENEYQRRLTAPETPLATAFVQERQPGQILGGDKEISDVVERSQQSVSNSSLISAALQRQNRSLLAAAQPSVSPAVRRHRTSPATVSSSNNVLDGGLCRGERKQMHDVHSSERALSQNDMIRDTWALMSTKSLADHPEERMLNQGQLLALPSAWHQQQTANSTALNNAANEADGFRCASTASIGGDSTSGQAIANFFTQQAATANSPAFGAVGSAGLHNPPQCSSHIAGARDLSMGNRREYGMILASNRGPLLHGNLHQQLQMNPAATTRVLQPQVPTSSMASMINHAVMSSQRGALSAQHPLFGLLQQSHALLQNDNAPSSAFEPQHVPSGHLENSANSSSSADQNCNSNSEQR